MRLTAALACVGCLVLASCRSGAPGSFGWAPVESPSVARGREVATRFDQESLFEISVEVNNAFSLDNRRAIAVAEEELRRVPGVRRVFGPAQLADLAVDGAGRISVRRVLERGASEGDDEAARQRVVRRADALGWFLATDGSRVRFLVDAGVETSAGADGDALVTGAGPRGGVRAALERAIASSGLQLLHAAGVHAGGEALWPRPGDLVGRWSSAVLAGAAILLALWAGRLLSRSPRRFPRGRRGLVIAAAVISGGVLFAFCAVAPVRGLALRGALIAAGAGALGLLGTRVSGGDATLARQPAARPPTVIVVLAAALVGAALWLAPRAQIGTQQWRRTPFLFVSVRGDLEQPAVLRELRRLTDFVRAQPGVDSAWSVADLFFGVAFPGGEVSRVPATVAAAGHLLAQAGRDPAVALELAPDHREALVVARFDDDATPIDRLQIHDSVARYLRADLRAALVQVDLSDPHLSPATRLVGKGVLASDARERIIRICARSGRPLNEGEIASVERFSRQAAILPAADVAKLKLEIAAVLRDFLQSARAETAGVRLAPAERSRLADQLGAASVDATVEDLHRALADQLGSQMSDSDERVTALALALQPRLALTRQRAAARINFRAMLYGADLPTDGMLSDEVRSATLEAMGPVVGIPVPAQTPGVLRLDAMAVGGAANDRALSDFLQPSLRWGLTIGAAALLVLLLWAGRTRGLLWWPVALGPAAVVTIVPALLGEPVGMLFLSLLSGAFAGGAAGTVALVAWRRA